MPEILYRDIPPGANEGAQAQAQGQIFWDGALDRTEAGPYATLEPGYWKLDGTRRLLPGAAKEEGYCSCVLSDDKGNFSQPVAMTISLDKNYTATGLTLEFDRAGQEWCTHLSVQWYRDTQLLAEMTDYPQNWSWIMERTVVAFDKVKILFYSTNRPCRFLRLNRLILGQKRIFGSDELRNLELYTQVDVSGLTLPGGTAQFELALEEGAQLTFQKNQTIQVLHRGRSKGLYYLDKAQKTGPGQYQVECVDGISLLAASQTMGGLYKERPFGEILEEILAGEQEFFMEEELREIPLSGWISSGTKRDALLQAAFGAGAMVTMDEEGILCLKLPPKAADKTLKKQAIFQGGTVTTKTPYTQVAVIACEYLPGDRTEIYSGEVNSGEHLIMTEEPCCDYEISGGKILSSGANCLRIQVDVPGKVTITGTRLVCRRTRFQSLMPGLEDNLGSNVLEAEGTMVSPARAEIVLERLKEYARNAQTVQQTVLPENLKSGDCVTTEKAFDGQLVGYILSMTTHLTGKAVAELEILGRDVELEAQVYPCGTIFAGEG